MPVKTMAELIIKDGAGTFGNAQAQCPHCGRAARPFTTTTPLKGWELTFFIPPIGCCSKNRRSA